MPKAPGWSEVACPVCKEPISAVAIRCPHCQSMFTPEQVNARNKEQQRIVRVGCSVALVLALFVGWYNLGGSPDMPEKPQASAKADAITLYKRVISAARKCDSAGIKLSDQLSKGDRVAVYRIAQEAEQACLTVGNDISQIEVPASVGVERHKRLTGALQNCHYAYVSKLDLIKHIKSGLDGETGVSAMAELHRAGETTQFETMMCVAGLATAAIGLGATSAELTVEPGTVK